MHIATTHGTPRPLAIAYSLLFVEFCVLKWSVPPRVSNVLYILARSAKFPTGLYTLFIYRATIHKCDGV